MSQRQQREKMQAQQMQGEKKEQQQQQTPEKQETGKQETGEKEQNDELGENNQRRDMTPEEVRAAALKERLGKLERWGVLPPRVTEEMLSTSGKEAPAEYRDIVSRYYKRMTKFYNRRR